MNIRRSTTPIPTLSTSVFFFFFFFSVNPAWCIHAREAHDLLMELREVLRVPLRTETVGHERVKGIRQEKLREEDKGGGERKKKKKEKGDTFESYFGKFARCQPGRLARTLGIKFHGVVGSTISRSSTFHLRGWSPVQSTSTKYSKASEYVKIPVVIIWLYMYSFSGKDWRDKRSQWM